MNQSIKKIINESITKLIDFYLFIEFIVIISYLLEFNIGSSKKTDPFIYQRIIG